MNGRETLLILAAGAGALALGYMGGGETIIKAIAAGSKNEELYGPLVDRMSSRLGLDPKIPRAIVSQESAWVPTARNILSGDHGLFQLNLSVAKRIRPALAAIMPEILYDPPNNVAIAEDLFREIMRAGITDAEGIFNSWNVGWPSYKRGITSPHIGKYLAFFEKYGGTVEA